MTSRRTLLTMKLSLLIAAALALVAVPLSARAADRMDELQAKFKERYSEIRKQKDAGLIGETSTGLLGEVKPGGDAAVTKLVADDNADRQELYGLIAKKEGTTVDVVARTNAGRNFQRAKTGDWLKADDGMWRQKP